VPCRAVPCRAVPCRAVPCRAVPCRAVPCRAVPCRAVPYRTVPYRTVPSRTVPCRTVRYRTVSPHRQCHYTAVLLWTMCTHTTMCAPLYILVLSKVPNLVFAGVPLRRRLMFVYASWMHDHEFLSEFTEAWENLNR
jgi:hypothetical protein